MKRLLFLVICGAGLLIGCRERSSENATSRPANATPVIAVIPKGTTHEYWKSIHAGAQKAAAETGVQIVWKGPLKEDDREEQIKVVEDFVSRGVNGIVLAPLDDQALVNPVASAIRSGIPVVIIDSNLKSDDYSSFIATDNYKGGQLAGEEMVRLLDGRGKVIMLRYEEGSASTTRREEGFESVIKKHPEIAIVSDNQYAGATAETAYQKSENLLAPLRGPDGKLAIDGIFCPNESSCFGMLRALQDTKLAGTVKFIGFDSSPKLVDALTAGQLDATVVQNPFRMGYLGVKTMVDVLKKKPVEKQIDTGATLVTHENMNKPEIQQLLNPPRAE